jgi:hypothetical protein
MKQVSFDRIRPVLQASGRSGGMEDEWQPGRQVAKNGPLISGAGEPG